MLAAEPRSVQAVDVDSRRTVYVPLRVALHAGTMPSAAAETALRPVASVSKVCAAVARLSLLQHGLPLSMV